jgi:hypothetical protein
MAFLASHVTAHDDYDELSDMMPTILRQTHTMLRAMLLTKLDESELGTFDQQEILLAGFSKRKGAMVATMYARWKSDGDLESSDFEPLDTQTWTTPWPDGELGEPPTADTHESMQRLAQQQVAYMRAREPQAPCGGRLILAESKRDSLQVRSADLGAAGEVRDAP